MSSHTLQKGLRWTARSWAAMSLLFLTAFIVGNFRGPGNGPTFSEWIGLALFPTATIVGLVIAFRKELLGGVVTIASLMGFYLWHFAVSGRLAGGPWFALIAAPGLLFLLVGLSEYSWRNSLPVSSKHG